jgi:hypothetical protein
MESKIYLTIAISSILAFALIAGIPAAFENVFAQGERPDGTTTGGDSGTTGGMTGSDSETTGGTGGDTGIKDETTNGGNATGGMSEGQTDPNGEGQVDLGTGGP